MTISQIFSDAKVRLNKPKKILKSFSEYRERRAFVSRLNDSQQDSSARMKENGYLFFQPDAAELEELLLACKNRYENVETINSSMAKAFVKQLVTPDQYDAKDILIRFALNEDILNRIAHYLGAVPFLEWVEVINSNPVDAPLVKSQLWHKDGTDNKMVKVFVNIFDVTEEHGPLSFYSRQDSKRVPIHKNIMSHYLSDEEISEWLDLSSKMQFTGPSGSAVMLDTANCYHMGSRCQKPRLVYCAYYSTGFGYYARHYPLKNVNWKTLPNLDKGALSDMQLLALGL